jgi:hypothetical protein
LVDVGLLSTNFNVKLYNLINPQNLKLTGNFEIDILDSDGVLIQNSLGLSNGTNVQMKTTGNFLFNKISTNCTSLNTIGTL